LNLRRKRSRKHKRENLRVTRENIQNVNDCWGMDFARGRRVKSLLGSLAPSDSTIQIIKSLFSFCFSFHFRKSKVKNNKFC
jgi:hypothetical protein